MHAGLKTWISAMAVAAAVCLTAAGQAGAYDQAHLDQLLKTGRCALCNLSHADLYRADLKGADINGSNLYLTDLEGADLRGADLTGTSLAEVNLAEAKLEEAAPVSAPPDAAVPTGAQPRRGDGQGGDCRLATPCAEWSALQREAREQRRGLWADKDTVPPWEWKGQ